MASVWTTRVAWIALPLVAGPTFADALATRSRPVQLFGSIGMWLTWAVVLIALLVPRTVSLTVVRIATPPALVASLWAATRGDASFGDLVAVGSAAVALVSSLHPLTGDAFVNGSSYGDERRMPLRAPGLLLLGPIVLAEIATVLGIVAGPLLLAARQWVAGAVALAVGAPVAFVTARALHGLARRWIVFVPAGVVVHDPSGLVDPVLLPRRMVRSFGPAPAETDALDLTQRALGLALEIEASEPLDLLLPRPGHEAEAVAVAKLLVSPTRPGAVLAEAERRRLPVQRAATPPPTTSSPS
jgi:hypothetical protein